MNFIKILKAMSFYRDELRITLKNEGKPFVIHCAKILESTSKDKQNDMCDELYKFCFEVQGYTLKPKAKRLDKKFILENYFAYADTLETFSTLLRHYRLLYKKKDNNRNDLKKFNNYKQFSEKVADELSKGSMTSNIMRNLVNTYLLVNIGE